MLGSLIQMSFTTPKPGAASSTARLSPTLGLLPIIAMTAAVAGPAFAQTVDLAPITVQSDVEGEAANSYTVTNAASGKATAPLIDTPKSVTVVTRKEMEERGATSLYDVLRTTPGITMRAGEGGVPAGDIPQIRGFDASNDIMIDGLRNASRTSYESFNLETVEITKGSDGVTTGAGSAGGSINLNSKVPMPGTFDDVSLSYGTGNFKRATLDSNRQVGDVGVRLNLMYQDADDLGGKKGKTSKRWGIAPSLSYQVDADTKVTAGLYYYKNEDMPDYGVRMSNDNVPDAYRRGSGTASDPWRPIDVPTDTFYGTPGRDFSDGESQSAYVRLDHEFASNLSFAATLRATRDDTSYLATQPGISSTGEISRGAKSSHRENDTLAFNAQLKGEADVLALNHSFAVGVDISKSKATQYGGYNYTPTPGNVSYTDPQLGNWTGTITAGEKSQWNETRSTTVYAFDTIDLSPQFEASFGLSYSNYDVTSKTATDSDKVTSDLVNGSAGLVYKPTEQGRFYASISSASTPGGQGAGTGGESADDSLNELDPERTLSYELGTKWLMFNDQLMLSASLFHTEKDNARVTNALGEVENIGKTRAQGIELGFAGQITQQWGVSGGYVYQDVKLIDGGYSTPRGGGTPYLNPGNGKQLTKIPKNTFSLWSTYEVNDALTFGAGATYVDQRVASYSTDGSVAGVMPSSWQTDLMVSYKFNQDTSLQLNVNNVFDKHIYGDSHVTQHVYTEPGRNFAITLKHSF
ncbi:TonB-dependent siderophore receptor [Pseudooceanicola spongiae]|uniref:TonB-dependent siderophore receptor n=2 Tax=Pseudooceanicola spongiae TaxID=2613965 RepID=A0A7L9WNB4_9RHOB|nr:TonB-dependent siderophore receptor [Pseudooceanicola spongiae]